MFFRAVRSMLFGLARIASRAESAGQEHAPGRPAPDGNSAGTSQAASTGLAGRVAAIAAIRTRARPGCALEQTQRARVNRGTKHHLRRLQESPRLALPSRTATAALCHRSEAVLHSAGDRPEL